MAHFDPTVCIVLMLSVGIIGSTRLGVRLVKSPTLFGVGVVAIWAAFLANLVSSGESQSAVMFGWFDEHQIFGEFHKLHVFSLSFGAEILTLIFGVTLAVLCRIVLGERGLGGQLVATLQFVAQLPHNLAAFLLGGISDSPHGPPATAFA